jgi:hypothetical protein
MTQFADLRNGTHDRLLAARLANGNVFNSKVTPNLIANLPAIMVQNDKMQAKNVQVICVVSMSNTWADDADTLVNSVIDTLMTDTTYLSLWNNIELYTVDYTVVVDQQYPIGLATITLIGRLIN